MVKIVTNIVTKEKDHVLITAPVLVPGEEDCDFSRGEEPLSAEKVEKMAHAYLDYRVVEKNHEYLETKKNIGSPVESWITREPMSLKNIDDEVNEYPPGTWMATTKITDKESMIKAEKGEYRGYSVTALEKDFADSLISAKSSAADLIKDIDNPVGFGIALVRNPCVGSAKICSIKTKKDSEVNKMTEENKEDKDFIKSLKEKLGLEDEESTDPEFATKEDLETMEKSIAKKCGETIVSAFKEYDEKNVSTKSDGDSGDNNSDDDSDNLTTEEKKELERLLKKKKGENQKDDEEDDEEDKKKKQSSKSQKIHNNKQKTVKKSDTAIVYEAMGRTGSGSIANKSLEEDG